MPRIPTDEEIIRAMAFFDNYGPKPEECTYLYYDKLNNEIKDMNVKELEHHE